MKKMIVGLFLLLVVGIIGSVVSIKADGGFSFRTFKVADKEVVNGDKIDSIDIDLSSSNVQVVPTKEKNITVELSGKVSKKLKNKYKLDVQEQGRTLKISIKGEDVIIFNIGTSIMNMNVDVLLPEKVYRSLKVKTSSGSNGIENLQAENIILKSSSGDIEARGSVSKYQFSFKSSSGEVSSENNQANEFVLQASSGSINAINQQGKQSTFHTSSGEINVSNGIGDLQADTSSGDIDINNDEVTGDLNASTSSGEVSVSYNENPNSLAVDFKGSSGEGNIGIKGLNYEEKSEHRIIGQLGSGEYKIQVRTSSGDFNLN
ncbi:DUF4097 family beta strand repeat-containing protein [Cytobacillus sp. Hz8]|uniref:DUF4097 family beta strand repeat-containing protein n=1 Tax=Cytobacillus sp. Hz8 TaxID=3347168 RepID=UPI0035DE9429